jgi:hypothetical protein
VNSDVGRFGEVSKMLTNSSNGNTIARIELRLAFKKALGKYAVYLSALLKARLRQPVSKSSVTPSIVLSMVS